MPKMDSITEIMSLASAMNHEQQVLVIGIMAVLKKGHSLTELQARRLTEALDALAD